MDAAPWGGFAVTLVGFLAAGFLLHAVGPSIGLPEDTGPVLRHVAHLGVLLLLFTIGLKLKLRPLLRAEVIGGGLIHFAISVAVFAPAAHWIADLSSGPCCTGCSTVRVATSCSCSRGCCSRSSSAASASRRWG
jgi:predicted Kef-type K+ transport protein